MKVNHDAALLWRSGLPKSGRRHCHEGVTSLWLNYPAPTMRVRSPQCPQCRPAIDETWSPSGPQMMTTAAYEISSRLGWTGHIFIDYRVVLSSDLPLQTHEVEALAMEIRSCATGTPLPAMADWTAVLDCLQLRPIGETNLRLGRIEENGARSLTAHDLTGSLPGELHNRQEVFPRPPIHLSSFPVNLILYILSHLYHHKIFRKVSPTNYSRCLTQRPPLAS
ncbi:hypothetical protein KC360_g195 [Hortaea werneckii]|nr:hypothetical protein KC344_g199 [Hortaea werneckii]KAI7180524.1 hypothetical protein KC360_g195 [Hortaea werneckii]